MVIHQGDVLWVDLQGATGSAPAYRRPAVVVQSDAFNQSRIATIVVVPITSSLKHADAPGNVRLPQGEANLPRPSVANVSQLTTVDREQVIGKLGRLSRSRFDQIINGIQLLLGVEPETER